MSLASETVVALPPYEIVGPPTAPAVLALGGISANCHVCEWWKSVAGPELALNTNCFRIVGVDFLDGGCADDGRPERVVTTHDQADAIAAVLDEIGVERLHAIVGASYGGMVALAFAERYPGRVDRLIVIGAAHRAHPMTTALRTIQRRIVELGLDTGRGRDALVLSRALAMTTYRTAREFADRFDSLETVESYLLHHGERFAERFTPERFLTLSLSGDLHSVDPARIRTPSVLVAAEGDTNVPREQLERLALELAAPCQLVDLPSIHGHDAFLTEPIALGRILTQSLS
jgi:homoserine O-acetyltransferase